MIRRPPRSTRTDTLFPTRRSSDLGQHRGDRDVAFLDGLGDRRVERSGVADAGGAAVADQLEAESVEVFLQARGHQVVGDHLAARRQRGLRSEEHTSELQSLMRISYAVFCLKKKTIQ